MHPEKNKPTRILRDALISMLIYALPVILMFAVFRLTGQKPWLKNTNGTALHTSKNNHQ